MSDEVRRISLPNVLLGVAANRCPRCLEGPVWRSLVTMHEACGHCGLRFMREPGYFTSAMVWSYALGALVVFPIFFLLAAARSPLWVNLGVPVVVLAILAPLLVRVSRLILLHTDPRPFEASERQQPG